MNIKAIIFDLDGTLLDTLADIALSMNQALIDHHLSPYALDDYRYFVGNGVEQLTTRALRAQNGDSKLVESVLQSYRKYYDRWKNKNTQPYNGIRELLEKCHNRQIKTVVFSNKPHQDTVKVIEDYFPNHSFAAVLGHQDNKPLKPDPTVLYEIIAKLKVNKNEVLYVGDTAVDMETATAAGLTPIGVTWGFRDEPELVKAGAAVIVSSCEQLMSYIEKRDER